MHFVLLQNNQVNAARRAPGNQRFTKVLPRGRLFCLTLDDLMA